MLRVSAVVTLVLVMSAVAAKAQTAPCCPEKTELKRQLLWEKLESSISSVDQQFDGVLGVAVLDLSDGKTFLLHGDEVFPQASSIKIAVLAELYRQEQQARDGAKDKA